MNQYIYHTSCGCNFAVLLPDEDEDGSNQQSRSRLIDQQSEYECPRTQMNSPLIEEPDDSSSGTVVDGNNNINEESSNRVEIRRTGHMVYDLITNEERELLRRRQQQQQLELLYQQQQQQQQVAFPTFIAIQRQQMFGMHLLPEFFDLTENAEMAMFHQEFGEIPFHTSFMAQTDMIMNNVINEMRRLHQSIEQSFFSNFGLMEQHPRGFIAQQQTQYFIARSPQRSMEQIPQSGHSSGNSYLPQNPRRQYPIIYYR
jgi:hypothetical protein